MLDFKELSKDGKEFELLIRELLFTKGYKVYWSGVGPDGGRDLLCIEERTSFFAADKKTWLIQCKHNAHSGKSVGIEDLDEIVDSCTQHGATGYILACSTQPSSAVVNRLENITKNPANAITAIFWDYVFVEQTLSTANLWRIAQRFFPLSAQSSTWKVNATESPNHWVVTFKGYYFHLANRIGSKYDYHFYSIERRITEIETIEMPENHFIRVRSIYFDDKNGGYTWYIDYMYPVGEQAKYSQAAIQNKLGHQYSLEDGQIYCFDVKVRAYMSYSDHYDPDHYDYYVPYTNSYRHGFDREDDWEDYEKAYTADDEFKEKLEANKSQFFNQLVQKLSEIQFLRIIRSCNARMEDLDRFHRQRNWSELLESMDLEIDRFFSAWFLFEVEDEEKFHKFITFIPQDIGFHFRLTKPYIYLPNDNGGCEFSEDDRDLYELTLSLHPAELTDKHTAREKLNSYYERIIKGLNGYINEYQSNS
jgi:hypothetical protein